MCNADPVTPAGSEMASTEIIDWTAKLQEAEAALHALNLGRSAVEVRDSDGSSIRYTSANSSRLKAYISELKSKIAGASSASPHRVMRPVWG